MPLERSQAILVIVALALLPLGSHCAPLRRQDSLSYAQDRLMRDLFKFYEKTVVAHLTTREPVRVSIAFTLTQINNLDEKAQVLTTTAWMEVLWMDERLSWKPEEYNGTKSIVVPPDYMWLPDIGLQNSANEIYHNSLVDKKFRVTLYHNGNVLWTPGGKFYTNCELNIDYFPFDDQRCTLHFTNWAYNGNEMNLTVTYNEIRLDNYQVNGEWEILHTSATREDKYYACCGDVPYPSVYFTIHIRRKYLYYVMNVIAPCVMLSLLVTLVFYLPSGTGEKISLGVTIFLAFIIFLLMVAESIPQNSDSVPILSVYLATFLALTTSSLFTSVVVLHIHHLSPDKKLPVCMRRFVFGYLARVLCMRSIHARYGNFGRRRKDAAPPRPTTISACPLLVRTTSFPEETIKADGWSRYCVDQEKCTDIKPDCNREQCADVAFYVAGSPTAPLVGDRPLGRDGVTSEDSPWHRNNSRNMPEDNEGWNSPVKPCERSAGRSASDSFVLVQLLEHAKAFVSDRLAKERVESAQDEWKAVAKVVDRCLLFTYVIFIVVATLIILVIMPLSSK